MFLSNHWRILCAVAAAGLLGIGRLVAQPLIVDHTCTNLRAIPAAAVAQAKSSLHIAYGHTSHGSQLVTGMHALIGFMNGFKSDEYPDNHFSWDAAFLHDYAFSGASDLGNPNFTAWETATRTYLASHTETNVVIWSWCGQVSGASEANINTYLSLMSGLESDFPAVRFVYMTGHLDGGGPTGNLHRRNEQIRAYCRANNKTLYDFADIESFDPDWATNGINYMTLKANDECHYDSDGNGTRESNWATAWQGSHVLGTDWFDCSPAHTEALNGNLKAYAVWWLWARLGGWPGPNPDTTPPSTPANLRTTALASGRVDLAWDASVDPESLVTGYRVFCGAKQLTQTTQLEFADTTVVPNTPYTYTVVAVNGAGLLSPASAALNVTTPADTTPPSVPTNLQGSPLSSSSISLTWNPSTDNVAVTGYRVYRDGDPTPVGSPTGTSFTNDGLAAGTPYAYTVAAVDAAGNASAQCTAVNVATPFVDLEAPSTPTGLAVGVVTASTIALSWNASSDNVGVTGYLVYRNGAATPFTTVATTGCTDSGLSASTNYSYEVAARDAAGNVSARSTPVPARTADPSAQEYVETLTGSANMDDTFLVASQPAANYGTTSYMGTTDRFVVRFNLPAKIDNKHIVRAELDFYVWNQTNYQANQYLDLYRMTRPWVEAEATWNLASTGVSWATAGAGHVAGDHAELLGRILHQQDNWDHRYYPIVDVTALVQKWVTNAVPNHGFLLVNASLTQIGLKASEYSSGPRLKITYTEQPATRVYGMWVHAHFTDAELVDPALEATVWGPDADPDGDGTVNRFEFALDTDPNDPASSAASSLKCTPVDGSSDLQLTFKRVKGLQGVSIRLRRSTDLANWSDVPAGGYVETAAAIEAPPLGRETVTWRITPEAGMPRCFYRLFLQAP